MVKIMAILNLTPDSFWAPSRYAMEVLESGADMIDIGAVSTRPRADEVSEEEEWSRLEPVLKRLDGKTPISIDTTRSGIVRRVFDTIGPFIVNDISAGLDDPEMLATAGQLGLPFIAMHKRGNPRTMDAMTRYSGGFMASIKAYFEDFALRAEDAGITDWVLDPGFGFAKTERQNIYLIDHMEQFKSFGKPILAGVADKRFTHGRTEEYNRRAVLHGADILRVHDVEAARRTLESIGCN